MSSGDDGTQVSVPVFDSSPRSSVLMRVSPWLSIVFLLASAGPLRADGGSVRARQTIGPYTVTVFTAPTPLRVGLADISVFIQHAQSNAAVLDAAVAVKLHAADEPARTLQSAATRAAAVNKLLYAAEIDLPAVDFGKNGGLGQPGADPGSDIVSTDRSIELLATTVGQDYR